MFGFHLAPIDLQAERQRARAHRRRTVRRRDPRRRISAAQRRRAHRIAAQGAALAAPARLAVRQIQRRDGRRTRHPAQRRKNPAHLRAGRDPHQHHLELRRRLRHAGAGAAAEGGGPRHGDRPRRRLHGAAVRDDRRPAQLRRRDGPPARAAGISPPDRLARPRAGGDARLFGLATRTAASSPRVGSSTRPRSGWLAYSSATTS